MGNFLNNLFSTLGSYLSDYILVAALLGGGVWFTVKLGFIQIRGFGEGIKRTFGGMFKKTIRRIKAECHHFRPWQQR